MFQYSKVGGLMFQYSNKIPRGNGQDVLQGNHDVYLADQFPGNGDEEGWVEVYQVNLYPDGFGEVGVGLSKENRLIEALARRIPLLPGKRT